jgi:CRISPR system Cascade subunit CasA
MSYSLLTEAWIPVRQSRIMQPIGLLDLFTNWEEISDIYADNPPRQIAIYRFLIALMHSALRGPESVAEYHQIWQDPHLGDRICKYLQQWQDRFDLLHPDRPFLQDPTITQINPTSIVKAVYQDANTPIIWFKPRDIPWLSLADAAQEVLRMQSLDLGGRKSDSITGSPGRWTQGRHVFPIGACLKETLLLNLARYESIEEDKPVWERDLPYGTGERLLTGYLDWSTYCERRILLTVDGDKVTHLRLASGWNMPSGNDYSYDRHQAFRFLSKSNTWLPLPFDAQKQLWDDSEAILHTAENANYRPKIFDWLSDCRKLKSPQPTRILGFARGVGATGSAKPVHWADDVLSIPISILDDSDIWEGVQSAIQLSRDFGLVFSSGTFKYARSEVDKKSQALSRGVQETIKAQLPSLQAALYSYIGQQFPSLLIDLADFDRVPSRIDRWQQQLRDYSYQLIELTVQTLPNYRSKVIASEMFKIAIYKATFHNNQEKSDD